LNEITFSASVEVVCKECFANCRSLQAVTFELWSKLRRIEEFAFGWRAVTDVIPHASVEVLARQYCRYYRSLTSIISEPESKLMSVCFGEVA
jgi:hypothetical protein